MSVPLLTTKLHIPQSRPNVVLRPRLIEQLNDGLNGRPGFGRKMTLISAPAGFGKTTLISGWLAACQYPTAWLSLDEGDKELQRFLVYFVAALQTVNQDIGKDMLGALQSPQVPPLEPLLSILLNEVEAASHDFMLVLDDYHLIDSKTADQALTFLLEHLPSNMHLVIASREDPALPLSRLRARRQLAELRAVDLRFTSTEAAEFLNQMMGLNLSADDIAALETRTEGWIAGLQLAALSMQGNQDIAGFIQSFSGAHRFVLDYLLEEVLERQPVSVQRFLLQTSILNRLCGPLGDVVLNTASGPGQKTLEYLDHANLFIIALDNERRWYRYHHLFRDLLRQRLSQEQTAGEIVQSHVRASEWYESNGDMAEAFHHAIAAKDFSRGAALAEMAWQGMNESFQNAAWLGWVNELPEALIRTRPVLCTQIAWSLMDAGKVDASEARLQDAERLLNGPAEERVVVEQAQFRALGGRIAFARAYNAQSLGNVSDTLKYAELALKLTRAEGEYLRAQTKAILTSAHWASGNLDAAYNAMHAWMHNSEKAGNYNFAIASAHGLAQIIISQGHLQEAVRTYKQSLQFAAEHGREVQRFTAHHHLGLAMLYLEMGSDEIAAQHLQTGLDLGMYSTLVDWPYHKCVTQARWKESEGDFDAAIEFLEEAKRVYVRTLMPDTQPVEALKARIYLKQGRLFKAQNWTQEQGLAIDDDLSYLHEFDLITLARVLVTEYQSSRVESIIRDALHLLDRLLADAEAGQRTGSVIEILILQVLAHDARGHRTKAVESLKRAVALAAPEGYMRIFVAEGTAMAELLAGLNESGGTAKGYVHKMLDAFEKKNELHPTPQPLIDPLSERELEVLRLVAQGLSNDQISKRLYLSVNTVKGHNLRIFGKLQVKNRTEAVVRARELGLL